MTNVELSNLNAANAASALSAAQQSPELAVSVKTASTSILSGDSVTVTRGFTDLEKLVAQLKSEESETRLTVAQQRLASVIDVLTSLTEDQRAAVETALAIEAEIESKESARADIASQYSSKTAQSLALEAKIEQLEKAVENNIKDGEEHRKNMEALTELRAEQAAKLAAAEANLAALESAEVQDATAIAEAKAAVNAAKSAISGTDAQMAALQVKIDANAAELASNRTALDSATSQKATVDAEAAELKTQLDALDAELSSMRAKVASAYASIGESTTAKLAQALTSDAKASEVTDGEKVESAEDVRKEELKDIANDPARVVREAMDRVGELLEDLKTIDAGQPVKA